jgi:hypothetical protein
MTTKSLAPKIDFKSVEFWYEHCINVYIGFSINFCKFWEEIMNTYLYINLDSFLQKLRRSFSTSFLTNLGVTFLRKIDQLSCIQRYREDYGLIWWYTGAFFLYLSFFSTTTLIRQESCKGWLGFVKLLSYNTL